MATPVRLSRTARAALSSLAPEERRQVESAISEIGSDALHDRSRVYAIGVPTQGDGLYVLRAADDLRVLFSFDTDGGIAVHDVVNRDFALQYG